MEKQSHENQNPFSSRDSIERDRDRCSANTTHTTLHTLEEERVPIQVRMKRSCHNTVANYLDKNQSFGDFYEKAAELYMDVNPKVFSPLIINKFEKNKQTFDDELEDIILVDELTDCMRHCKPGKKVHITKKKNIVKLLKRCKKLDVRSEELEQLAIRAVGYVKGFNV